MAPKTNQIRVGKADARGHWRPHNHRHVQIASQVTGLVQHRLAGMRIAAAQPVRNLVLTQHRGQPLHVALMGRGQHHPRSGSHQRLQLLGQRRNGAVEAERGPRVHLNLAQRPILVQHVHRAQLIQIEPHLRFQLRRQDFGTQINVLGP